VRKAGPCRAGGAGCVRVGARGALGTQAIADTTDLPSCHRSQSAWREFSSECVQIKEDRYHEMKNTARMAEFSQGQVGELQETLGVQA